METWHDFPLNLTFGPAHDVVPYSNIVVIDAMKRFTLFIYVTLCHVFTFKRFFFCQRFLLRDAMIARYML